jgi:hypothetical protein
METSSINNIDVIIDEINDYIAELKRNDAVRIYDLTISIRDLLQRLKLILVQRNIIY